MASLNSPSLDQLLVNIELRERTARKRALLYTIAPIIIAASLLFYTAYRIRTATKGLNLIQQEANRYQGDARKYQLESEGFQNQVKPLQTQIGNYQEEIKDYRETQIPSLKGQVNHLKTLSSGYEDRIGNLRGDIVTLKQQASGLITENSNLTLAKNTLTAEIEPLKIESIRLRSENDKLKEKIAELKKGQEEAEARLKEATDLVQFVHNIDFVDAKAIAVNYRSAAAVFSEIRDLQKQKVRFVLGGNTPDEGFDSPSFATFILKAKGLLNADIDSKASHEVRIKGLRDLLTPASEPRIGDVVFYPAGYALFYFVDSRGQPFVIGMTPDGITALNVDFAKPVGFGRVAYKH
jgi:regulator of replication initiation timing